MENEPEHVLSHINAADVMANQIAALTVERDEISIPKIEEIFSCSYCFADSDPRSAAKSLSRWKNIISSGLREIS